MNSLKFLSSTAITAILVAALAACGGGGGGDTAATTPVTPATPVVNTGASTIVTTVPNANYSWENQQAYNRLNTERNTCGFGKVEQSVNLDLAAQAHADYLLINNVYGHYEDATAAPTGFTGVDSKARTTVAGYPLQSGTGTEDVTGSMDINGYTGYGEISVRRLTAALYHLTSMMMPNNDVGVAVRSVASVTPLVANGTHTWIGTCTGSTLLSQLVLFRA